MTTPIDTVREALERVKSASDSIPDLGIGAHDQESDIRYGKLCSLADTGRDLLEAMEEHGQYPQARTLSDARVLHPEVDPARWPGVRQGAAADLHTGEVPAYLHAVSARIRGGSVSALGQQQIPGIAGVLPGERAR